MLPLELGKYVERDVTLLQQLGWTKFVQMRRGRGDMGSLNFNHPAKHILTHYKYHGVPMKVSTEPGVKASYRRRYIEGRTSLATSI